MASLNTFRLSEFNNVKIKHLANTPLTAISLHLAAFLFYFSDLSFWWLAILICQFTLSLAGLFIPNWRIISSITAIAVLMIGLQWFYKDAPSSVYCKSGINSFIGIVKEDSHNTSNQIDIIKCQYWCEAHEFSKPSARILIPTKLNNPYFQFKPGDKIELRNLNIIEETGLGLVLQATNPLRLYNLSYQQKIISRNKTLVFIQNKASYYLDGFSLGILKSLLTADRTGLSKKWKSIFRELGISHIFAISGLHIGILYLWISSFLRRVLAFQSNFVLKGRLILFIDLTCITAIFFFIQMIGAPISAFRAFIMLSWWILIKHYLNWQPLWFVLSGTALLILFANPTAIGQISFQLSFLSVFAILLILPLLPTIQKSDSLGKRIYKRFYVMFVLSLWLSFFTLPIVQRLTIYRSAITPINNVVHIGIVGLIILPALLFVLISNILSFYLGLSIGEQTIYAIVDLIFKTWEQILIYNHQINTNFLLQIPDIWNSCSLIFYWVLLISLVFLFRIKTLQLKT